MAVTAGEVMNQAAVFLNDRDRATWTYTVLLPYLKAAWDELLVELENNHVKSTKEVSSLINVTAGATAVTLPNNLINIVEVKERTQGSSEDFTSMDEADWPLLNYTPGPQLLYWTWIGESLQVPAATSNREVKLRYVKSIGVISDENTNLPVINCKPYLAYKTAALAADFSGRAPDVAQSLEIRAGVALHKMLSIKVGALQSKPVRRPGWR